MPSVHSATAMPPLGCLRDCGVHKKRTSVVERGCPPPPSPPPAFPFHAQVLRSAPCCSPVYPSILVESAYHFHAGASNNQRRIPLTLIIVWNLNRPAPTLRCAAPLRLARGHPYKTAVFPEGVGSVLREIFVGRRRHEPGVGAVEVILVSTMATVVEGG